MSDTKAKVAETPTDDPRRQEKPTTLLEDTSVVDDDGTVDMAGMSKSGHAYPSGDPEPTYDSDEVFLGFLAGALLSSAAWGAVWVAAITV